MDIPAAHNDAQGLSVMRSAPKLRPRTPMSGLVLPSCAQRRPWPAQAGTGTCVHIPIQLIPIASLAWLGKQQPCPLLFFNFLLGTEVDTHTHGLQGKVRNPKKSIPRKGTQQKQPTTQKRKRQKENPEKEPLTFVRGLKKLVARKGQVEGNEPEVSRGPSNTGS